MKNDRNHMQDIDIEYFLKKIKSNLEKINCLFHDKAITHVITETKEDKNLLQLLCYQCIQQDQQVITNCMSYEKQFLGQLVKSMQSEEARNPIKRIHFEINLLKDKKQEIDQYIEQQQTLIELLIKKLEARKQLLKQQKRMLLMERILCQQRDSDGSGLIKKIIKEISKSITSQEIEKAIEKIRIFMENSFQVFPLGFQRISKGVGAKQIENGFQKIENNARLFFLGFEKFERSHQKFMAKVPFREIGAQCIMSQTPQIIINDDEMESENDFDDQLLQFQQQKNNYTGNRDDFSQKKGNNQMYEQIQREQRDFLQQKQQHDSFSEISSDYSEESIEFNADHPRQSNHQN